MVQPLWKTVWRCLKKRKIELPYDPAIPLVGIYMEKVIIQKTTGTPVFIAVLFTIAKTWKQSKCPSTEEWIKKIWYLYIMEYCSCLITTSCLTLRCVSDCSPPGSSVHGTYQARILEWVAIFLLQRIFPALGSNPCLLHWQADSLLLSHQGSPVEYYSAIKKE